MAQQALGHGHEVTVMGRRAAPSNVPDGAQALAADVLEPGALNEVIVRVDAVITALSIPRKSRSPFAAVTGPPDLHSRATTHVLSAMKDAGIKRLIKLSAHGVGGSALRAGWGFRALVACSNLRPAFADHARADAAGMNAQLSTTRSSGPPFWKTRQAPAIATHYSPGKALQPGHGRGFGFQTLQRGVIAALDNPEWFRRTLTLRPGSSSTLPAEN